MIELQQQQIADGARLYDDFLKGIGGGFYYSLFNTIVHADPFNKARLAKGFPECVYTYLAYTEGSKQILAETEVYKIEKIGNVTFKIMK